LKTLSVPLFLLVLLGAASVSGQTFTEFPVPSNGTAYPWGITAGPDGNLWFTVSSDPAGPKIGRITPEGAITQFAIPTVPADPSKITTGPDGNLWFTETNDFANRIGRVSTSGSITEFPIPSVDSRPLGIAAGPDGALWFAEQKTGKIGRITTSGAITEFPIPGSAPGIASGPDGGIWFTDRGSNKIGRITTSGAITEFPIPTPVSEPVFITAGPDGALWFTEYRGNKIGRITTSGEITEFPIPTPGSAPQDIVAGLDGNLYFAESAGNKIGRITTSGTITEFPIPTPGSSPWGIAWGPDGAIWFAETYAGKIGRLSIERLPQVERLPPVRPSHHEGRPRVLPPRNSPTADLYLAPSTPQCSGLTEVTGIYQDGRGTYLPGDSVVWADTPNGIDLRIKPLCSGNRRLNALLPSAAMALLTGPINPCQDSGSLNTIQLKVPDLHEAPTGVVGKPSLPPDYPKAESVYFYFLVDSNHDGRFDGRDDGYNLVWQSGIYLTRTEYFDRTVYELTTDLTSPNAELLQGIGNGGSSKGVFCVPLRLTVTQPK
jgi:streptogramin lyase